MPGSHIDLWADFTSLVINALNNKSDIVWMLWGAFAGNYETMVTNPTHHIIKTGHPSPLNRSNPFVGSDCFIECNKILGTNNINWIK
jgi:uracil-DNA glycosylase